MKIDTIRIRNFRCFGEDADGNWDLVFRPNRNLSLLIGPNGSGKTAILDAIDIVLNAEGRSNQSLITEYDFPICDTSKTITIDITLTDLGQLSGKFESDIQWINPENGIPLEDEGTVIDENKHLEAVIIRFEARLDPEDGEIKWNWLLSKFPKTEMEDTKELSRSQHLSLGYFRIRPAITAGAFTLGQYSVLGRYLRKLRYRLGKLPDNLRSESRLPKCSLENLRCDVCLDRSSCIPRPEDDGSGFSTADESPTLGFTLQKIVAEAKDVLGSYSWNKLEATLGPRYGGLSSALAALTLGMSPTESHLGRFIPFDRFSLGEKYALSFALAKSQVPGDLPPVILMEEPETAMHPSAIATLLWRIQSVATGECPQVVVSSHSESVLRCFTADNIFVLGKNRQPRHLMTAVESVKPEDGPLSLSNIDYFVMPGGPSALFSDKVLFVEGAQEAIVAGRLDRLAAEIAAKKRSPYDSFSSRGWCLFQPAGARNASDHIRVVLDLGKKVAALFDGDAPGKETAQLVKDLCPTFIYKSAVVPEPTLEDALLCGLHEQDRETVLKELVAAPECLSCEKNSRKCWTQRGECHIGGRDDRKNYLQNLCLRRYFDKHVFPKVFAHLVAQLDSAATGSIHKLMID